MREVKGPVLPLNMSMADAWSRLADMSKAHLYVPGLTDVKITTEATTGVGASRKVFGRGSPMDETVVEWNEGEGYLLLLHFGEKRNWGPFQEAYFHYSLVEQDGQASLSNAMSFVPKGAALFGWLLYPLFEKVFAKSLLEVSLAQRLFYQTGERVPAESLAQAKSEYLA